jgi:hypothetical protein
MVLTLVAPALLMKSQIRHSRVGTVTREGRLETLEALAVVVVLVVTVVTPEGLTRT